MVLSVGGRAGVETEACLALPSPVLHRLTARPQASDPAPASSPLDGFEQFRLSLVESALVEQFRGGDGPLLLIEFLLHAVHQCRESRPFGETEPPR